MAALIRHDVLAGHKPAAQVRLALRLHSSDALADLPALTTPCPPRSGWHEWSADLHGGSVAPFGRRTEYFVDHDGPVPCARLSPRVARR